MIIGLVINYFNTEFLNAASKTIREGIFSYEGEPPDEEHFRIKKRAVSDVRRLAKIFSTVLVIGAISNTVFVSLMHYFFARDDCPDRPLNPYLPQPLYIPFNTRTTVGFAGGFLINVVYMFLLIGIVSCLFEIYVSSTVQMKAEFEILNYSLVNIERRARLLYAGGGTGGAPAKALTLPEDLFAAEGFQECLCKCLRNNVLHHHALLR